MVAIIGLHTCIDTVGAIYGHHLAITYFNHLGEYCTGCGSSLGFGSIYRCANESGKGVDGGERAVLSVAASTHSTAIYLLAQQHFSTNTGEVQFYISLSTFIVNGDSTQRELTPGPWIISAMCCELFAIHTEDYRMASTHTCSIHTGKIF